MYGGGNGKRVISVVDVDSRGGEENSTDNDEDGMSS